MTPDTNKVQFALDAGYSQEEIDEYFASEQEKINSTQPENILQKYNSDSFLGPDDISTKVEFLEDHPFYKDKIAFARENNYSEDQIQEYLDTDVPEKKERGLLEKAARLPMQTGLASIQSKVLPWEFGTASLAQPQAQSAEYRHQLAEDIQHLRWLDSLGIADEKDKELLESFENQFRDIRQTAPFVKTADLSVPGIFQSVTGIDTHPEGYLETAAQWLGFLKDPVKGFQEGKNLIQGTTSLKEISKNLIPGTKALRAATAAGAIEAAEQGGYGPIGTMTAAIVGDLVGGQIPKVGQAASKTGKAVAKTVKNPKESVAKLVAKTSKGADKELISELSKDAKELGIPLDAGTLTGSNLVKTIQTKAAQSGIVGESLDNFRKDMSSQIKEAYTSIADEIGEIKFETSRQAVDDISSTLAEQNLSTSKQVPEVPKNQRFVDRSITKKIPKEGENYPLRDRIDVDINPTPEVENLLNDVSPTETVSSETGGRLLKEEGAIIKRPITEQFNQRYTAFTEEYGQVSAPQPELAPRVNEFVASHEGSLLLGESSAEAKVVRVAQRLRDEVTPINITQDVLETSPRIHNVLLNDEIGTLQNRISFVREVFPADVATLENQLGMNIEAIGNNIGTRGERAVSVDTLIKSKRTLAAIPNWELGTKDIKDSLKSLVSDLDEAINRTLRNESPVAESTYRQLSEDYSQFKEIFEDKNVRKLFERRNFNYNSIYNGYIQNPDKLRALERVMNQSENGQNLIREIKRDLTSDVLSRPTINGRQVADLNAALGPEFNNSVDTYIEELRASQDRPLPRARRPEVGSREIPIGQQQARIPDKKIKATVSPAHKSRKFANLLGSKTDAQVLAKLDTVSGIREIKGALSGSEKGKQLFDDLMRYKLEQMIADKMGDSITQQVKLGTFSKLGAKQSERAILKEILGQDSLNKMLKIQKVSGRLAETSNKFYNASQSGSVAADTAALVTAGTAVLTGNAWMLSKVLTSIGGMRAVANLLSDKEFLTLLEKEVLKPSSSKNIPKELKKVGAKAKEASREAVAPAALSVL